MLSWWHGAVSGAWCFNSLNSPLWTIVMVKDFKGQDDSRCIAFGCERIYVRACDWRIWCGDYYDVRLQYLFLYSTVLPGSPADRIKLVQLSAFQPRRLLKQHWCRPRHSNQRRRGIFDIWNIVDQTMEGECSDSSWSLSFSLIQARDSEISLVEPAGTCSETIQKRRAATICHTITGQH